MSGNHIQCICTLPRLEVLRLDFNTSITGAGFSEAMQVPPQLREIYLENCKNF